MESNWSGLARSYLNSKYFLKEHLGDDGERAAFLAQSADNMSVLVRLMKAETPAADAWENHWSSLAPLSHEHLLEILEHDRCRIDGTEYVYVVSERPDENLGDVLKERALTAGEARAVLESTLPALQHLHANGYVYTDYRPVNIVAVGERIKLTTDAIRKLPDDETGVRSASAAEIRQVGETLRAMIAQNPGARAGELPQPFAGIAKACSLAGEDWSPTPDQLRLALDGGELPRRKPKAQARPVVTTPETPRPVIAEPQSTQENRRAASPLRSSRAVIAIAGLTAVLLIFLFWSAEQKGAAGSNSTVRTETPRAEYGVVRPPGPTAESRPSPVARQNPATPPAPPKVRGGDWSVVAAIYRDYDAAHRRAASIAKSWKSATPSVYPAERNARKYMVVLGSGLSREEAERLRAAALAAGMPPDSYVTRLGGF